MKTYTNLTTGEKYNTLAKAKQFAKNKEIILGDNDGYRSHQKKNGTWYEVKTPAEHYVPAKF